MTDTAFASDKPDLVALEEQFVLCAPQSLGWDRLADADAIRYMEWTGQSPDGRKHQAAMPEGVKVFPFEGGSDMRWPTADSLVREHTAFLTEAFHRAMTRVQGNPEAESSGAAGYARKLMEWMRRGKLFAELNREVRLLAEYGCHYGAALLQIGWERTFGYELRRVTMEELMAAAQQRAAAGVVDALTMFPQMLLDPAQDDQSIEVLQTIYEHYVQTVWPEEYGLDTAPLKDTRARQAIRSLREDGKCDLPLPYLCKNQPVFRARKLWEDVFVPDVTPDIQGASVVFLVDYYHEAALRAKARADDWDETWVEEAVKQKGMVSSFATMTNGSSSAIAHSLVWSQRNNQDIIEVITALRKRVDADGVLQVYETIYHGNIKRAPRGNDDLVAKHGPVEFQIGDQLPLVDWRFETTQRSLCSARGIPEMVAGAQGVLKTHVDMLMDRAMMETVPARLVDARWGMNALYGPAVDVGLKSGQLKPEYMGLPPTSRTSEGLVVQVQQEVDRYFSRPGADVPPELALIARQQLVRGFLASLSQALAMCFKLMATQLPAEQIQKISGLPGGSFGSVEDIASDTVYVLSYDVQEMNPEFREARNKRLLEMAATDPTNTIDRSKLLAYIVRSEDPDVAAEIITGQEGRNAAVFKQVKQDLDDIFKGIPPQLVENDPTAGAKLEFANQVIGVSPVYQRAFQQPGQPQELLKKYVEALQFAHEQTTTNKQIGRVGVDMSTVTDQQQAA